MEFKPIKDAPKDRQIILIYANGAIHIGSWNASHECFVRPDYDYIPLKHERNNQPVKWMELRQNA